MKTPLRDYLNYYSKLDSPGFAVLVTGDWGIGKTYQVKLCLPEDSRIYVSLYGVATLEQLNSEVYVAAHPNGGKVGSLANKIGKIATASGGIAAAFGTGVSSLSSAYLKRSIKPNKTLIFDDLERSNLSDDELLGAINSYVEHLGFGVIVIAHDKKLSDDFTSKKEKTFGQTLKVQPQIETVLDSFLEKIVEPSAKAFAKAHEIQIKNIFESSGEKSLRILRHVIEDLLRLHEVLKEEHLQHSEAMNELVQTSVALNIEIRTGKLVEADIRRREQVEMAYYMKLNIASEDSSKPSILEANERYPSVDLLAGLLNEDILISMFFDGHYNKSDIQNSIQNSHYFLIPDAAPPWKVVIQFETIDDHAVQQAVEKMEGQFNSRVVQNSGEILHICALRMMMSDKGIADKKLEETFEECKTYIDDLLEGGNLPSRNIDWNWKEEFENSHGGFAYWKNSNTEPLLKKIVEYLIACREKAFEREIPKICNELLGMIQENTKDFFEAVSVTNNGPNPYSNIPLMHQIPASEFVDAWLNTKFENWRYVAYALEGRYGTGQLEQELKSEKSWALEVVAELNARAAKEKGFRRLRIERIQPSILVALAKTENHRA